MAIICDTMLRSSLAFGVLGILHTHAAPMTKPNIIMILADDQGWGDVGYNKYSYQDKAYKYNYTLNPPRTPNLDAMAFSENSILFHRFYAGSGVCSPTRSALLTGRTPDRECITGAEGCGQAPAWSCLDKLPLPPATFTVAEAAKKANYSTIHIGKWHLGDFFYKGKAPEGSPYASSYAYSKWPVSNPGMHGFDEWHSTEASASSTTPNCACKKEWVTEGQGCITGGGEWHDSGYECTNYWFPLDLDDKHRPSRPLCHNELNGTGVRAQDCVGNLTEKITGDDSEHIMDIFEDFLTRKIAGGSEAQPFMGLLWLHTVHEPHPALPEFYHNYTDVFGDPAGDYLGTLTQMDVQIGRLRAMLKTMGIAENTMIWYTADNGPHSESRDRNLYSAMPATNGLRQCKASLYEGGIRVPGILEWPAMIKSHSETWHPAYVSDYLPTLLELLGVEHDHPTWAADGMSLMPLITSLSTTPNTNDTTLRSSARPLVFQLEDQIAIVNNWIKIVRNPAVGQCNAEPGSMDKGTFLFNISSDPTESYDLSKNPLYASLFAEMSQQLTDLAASITNSSIVESECAEGSPPSPGPPGPSPPGPPLPPTPPKTSTELVAKGNCLTIDSTTTHPVVLVGECNGGSGWNVPTKGEITNAMKPTDSNSLKVDLQHATEECSTKNEITVAARMSGDTFMFVEASGKIQLEYDCTPLLCVSTTTGKAQLVACSDVSAAGWTKTAPTQVVQVE
eukprot:m.259716 g.259716  ORF g.259716 m.259716 type:complete len:733 (-) comp38560_c0_seq1:181-2379(-)